MYNSTDLLTKVDLLANRTYMLKESACESIEMRRYAMLADQLVHSIQNSLIHAAGELK